MPYHLKLPKNPASLSIANTMAQVAWFFLQMMDILDVTSLFLQNLFC